MRTVTESFLKRLVTQRNEAETLSLNKIASDLSRQISVLPTRPDDSEYSYEYDEVKKDIEGSLWDAAIRAQDFYGKTADARQVADLIEIYAEEFLTSIKNSTNSLIGAYEKTLPGEMKEITTIEVSEEENE